MKPQNSLSSRSYWTTKTALTLLVFVAAGCNPPRTSAPDSVKPHASKKAKTQEVDQAKPPILITVSISPESRVKAASEDIVMELQTGIWKDFLIDIDNAAGITAPLKIESEQLMQNTDDTARDRWLQFELEPNGVLTGKRNERRTFRLRSRDSGIRTAILNFNAGQGTQDLGFRSDVLVTFKVSKP